MIQTLFLERNAFFREFAHRINNSESGRMSTVAARYLIFNPERNLLPNTALFVQRLTHHFDHMKLLEG